MRRLALLWPELAPTIGLLHRASLMSDSNPFCPFGARVGNSGLGCRSGRPTMTRKLQESMPLARTRFTLCDHVGNPQDWSYTWQLNDDVTLSSSCGFCQRDTLRLTYEVVRGDETAWICPNCVSRYAIGANLDGQAMPPKDARAYAHGLTARLKQTTCQDVLRRVQAENADPELEEVVIYFDRNLQLSPLRAAKLFAAMVRMGEQVNARIFEVQTRSNAHQQEFGELSEADRSLVWIALSPQQRRRLASLGFAPADTLVHRSQVRRLPRVEVQLSAPRKAPLTETASPDLAIKIRPYQ
jgi:hypothetical protein